MKYVERTPGTPVFQYDIPYNAFEEHAYQNRDYFGDDPDWTQVKADYMSTVEDSLMPFRFEVDDINRRSVFHEVNFRESDTSYSFIIWISDRPLSGVYMDPTDVVEERQRIIDRLEIVAARNGFYEDLNPESSPEWKLTAPKGKKGRRHRWREPRRASPRRWPPPSSEGTDTSFRPSG